MREMKRKSKEEGRESRGGRGEERKTGGIKRKLNEVGREIRGYRGDMK
jgi:hypothetical protein